VAARLGCPSIDVQRRALNHCKIWFVNKTELDFCSSCCMGKAHGCPLTCLKNTYSHPFELIYTDLLGPAPFISNSGYSYYISFVDAYSWFTWIYILKERKHRHIISFGISHRGIFPHTRHQNRVVKRKHRHIAELELTLLAQASIPYKFWDCSFLTTVYLINRLLTSSLNFDVPYTKLFAQPPDYSFIQCFGCSCFPLLRPYNKHKLQFCLKSVSLGYSTSHKGYKCLASNGHLYVSKVIFNEHRFPYLDLFPPKSNTTHSASTPDISPSIPIIGFPPVTPSVPPGFSVSSPNLHNRYVSTASFPSVGDKHRILSKKDCTILHSN